MRVFQEEMLEPENETLDEDLNDIATLVGIFGISGYGTTKGGVTQESFVEDIKQIFIKHGWKSPRYNADSEPRKAGDDMHKEKNQ